MRALYGKRSTLAVNKSNPVYSMGKENKKVSFRANKNDNKSQ